MPDQTPTAEAVPYTAGELEAVRPIIGRYNGPESPQRRLLATLDQYLAPRAAAAELEAAPAALVLERIGEAASTIAAWGPLALDDTVDGGAVRWCAVGLAELVAALLRGDRARVVELADKIAETVEDARTVAGELEAGEAEVCEGCGDVLGVGVAHRCPRGELVEQPPTGPTVAEEAGE